MKLSSSESLSDGHGYPTPKTLRTIRKWPSDQQRINELLDLVAAAWHWPDFGVSRELRPAEAEVVHAEEGERFLRLATCGWSGNEDLIEALNRSTSLAWFFTWKLSASGGLHIFRYLNVDTAKSVDNASVSVAVGTPEPPQDS